MKPRFRLGLSIVAALAAGLIAGEILSRSAAFRDFAGRMAGRGGLVALTGGKGIYQSDLALEGNTTAADLVIRENLKRAARGESVAAEQIDGGVALVAAQFADDKAYQQALQAEGMTGAALREKVANQLRAIAWLEKQVALGGAATEAECRSFYEKHPQFFAQPVRYRASHVFLAANAGTPPEVTEEKELAIAAYAAHLGEGETLPQIASEASEDENTKTRGGDLGFFAETRMPGDFIAEIKKLRLNETSKPFRTNLGFHIAQLTDLKEAGPLGFNEARPAIALLFANNQRAHRVNQLAEELGRPGHSR